MMWFTRLRERLRGSPGAAAAAAELRAEEERLARADVLLAEGRRDEAMAEFLAVFSREPTLLDHFSARLDPIAGELGGEVWLAYRLIGLRAALEAARTPSFSSDADELAELLRESYVELLEEHRGSSEATQRIRAIGRLIDEATSRGELPRALIRRAPR